jgi:hypothetical protein
VALIFEQVAAAVEQATTLYGQFQEMATAMEGKSFGDIAGAVGAGLMSKNTLMSGGGGGAPAGTSTQLNGTINMDGKAVGSVTGGHNAQAIGNWQAVGGSPAY